MIDSSLHQSLDSLRTGAMSYSSLNFWFIVQYWTEDRCIVCVCQMGDEPQGQLLPHQFSADRDVLKDGTVLIHTIVPYGG